MMRHAVQFEVDYILLKFVVS